MLKALGWGIALYVLYSLYEQGVLGQFGLPGAVVAIPGTQIPLPGGFGVTLPTGTTYRLRNGHTVVVPQSTETSPGGWALGTYDDGSPVWFNTNTGALQAYQGY